MSHRFQRANQMLGDWVKAGHKINYKNIIEMQHDTLDIQARDSKPDILASIEKGKEAVLNKLFKNNKAKADQMRADINEGLVELAKWNDKIELGEVGASYFMVFEFMISSYL